nr:ribonuclease H-like domain-containing protein [Tanacetum cinerariifolium]
MHNDIMTAGSRDRPPMLALGRYPQWRLQFLRYVDTRPNGEALRKCILSGPYKPTTVLVEAVEATDDSLAVPKHTTIETPTNMSPENKAYFLVEKEAIHLILTGIGDDIYSTVDAYQTTQEMFVTIVKQQHKLDEVSYHKLFDILKQYQNEVNELRVAKIARNANPLALVATAQASQDQYYQTSRSHKSSAPSPKPSIPSRSHTTTRHKGKEIAKPITPPSETASKEDNHSKILSDSSNDEISSDDDAFEDNDINHLIANIESLNDNPTPDRVLNSSFSIPIFEEYNNSLSYSDDSSPEFEIRISGDLSSPLTRNRFSLCKRLLPNGIIGSLRLPWIKGKDRKKETSPSQRRRIGRDDMIGTREIFDPKQRRYQAVLHHFQLVYSVIVENPYHVFHIDNAPPSIFNFSCHFFFIAKLCLLKLENASVTLDSLRCSTELVSSMCTKNRVYIKMKGKEHQMFNHSAMDAVERSLVADKEASERFISVIMKDISDDSTNDPRLEEVDLFLSSDNSIPPGIENINYDSKGDIPFLKDLLVDDSIPFLKNESSDFDHQDDLSFPRPLPEPPDVEFFFNFEPNSEVVILDELNKDECFDPGGEIDVFENVKDDDYFPFIFVI